jgi:hypothetical protein
VNPPTIFAVDSNVFIQSARTFYAFDIAPAFWQALIAHAERGSIRSIDRVRDEISRMKDPLKEWVDTHFDEWFSRTDTADTVAAYGRLMQWGYANNQFTDAAKSEFAHEDNADPWLVAHALAANEGGEGPLIVVTQEKFDAQIRSRIKIPNLCREFDVECIDAFEMLRRLNVRF